MSITLIIVGITAITSFMAFSNHDTVNKLIFWPYQVWRNNEWYRLLSGGFIHADWAHLIFNMIALYSFGTYLEASFKNIYGSLGPMLYLVLYLGAITLSDIYNLFTQKENYYYRSLGASGGVSAVIFAAILLNPYMGIGFMFIPVPIPAYIFGPIYLLYCIVMAKRGSDNIGHIAHFTGSVIGFIFPIIFAPYLLPRFIHLLTMGGNG